LRSWFSSFRMRSRMQYVWFLLDSFCSCDMVTSKQSFLVIEFTCNTQMFVLSFPWFDLNSLCFSRSHFDVSIIWFLNFQICVFYLVLRGLDTVEDDMAIPNEKKLPMLRVFHTHLTDDKWNIDGMYGCCDSFSLISNKSPLRLLFSKKFLTLKSTPHLSVCLIHHHAPPVTIESQALVTRMRRPCCKSSTWWWNCTRPSSQSISASSRISANAWLMVHNFILSSYIFLSAILFYCFTFSLS
jgi:hypothetical protein